jgi:hypothetical protein
LRYMQTETKGGGQAYMMAIFRDESLEPDSLFECLWSLFKLCLHQRSGLVLLCNGCLSVGRHIAVLQLQA